MSKVRRVVLVSLVALAAAGLRTFTLPRPLPRPRVCLPHRIPHGRSPLRPSARHGGLVLMNGDTHFEVVLDTTGSYSVYSAAVCGPRCRPRCLRGQNRCDPERPPARNDCHGADPTNSYWLVGHAMDDADAIVRVGYTATPRPTG